MPVTTRNQEKIALEQQRIAVEKTKVEIKQELLRPDIMYIVCSEGPSLYNQPLPDTFEILQHTSLPDSLEESLLQLIIKMENTCIRHDAFIAPPGYIFRTPTGRGTVETTRNLSTVMYTGNLHFVNYNSDNYESVAPPEDRFFQLLRESRDSDRYYQHLLTNLLVSNAGHPSAADLREYTVPAMITYLRYKIHPQVSGTWLDAYIVANAYEAELFIYDMIGPFSEHGNYYSLSSKSMYNRPLSDRRERPVWILIRAYTGCGGQHRWYAITSKMTSSMSYTYSSDAFSTKLIERIES